MKVIQINYLPHNNQRFSFSKWCLNELTKIKNENKEKIYLKIYSSYNDTWEIVIDNLRENGIDCGFVFLDGYMPKIFDAINSECPYSCKWDEDVFLNYNSWDYILENLDFLNNNSDVLFLSPIITN